MAPTVGPVFLTGPWIWWSRDSPVLADSRNNRGPGLGFGVPAYGAVSVNFTGKGSGISDGQRFHDTKVLLGSQEQLVLRDCVVNGDLLVRAQGSVAGHYGHHVFMQNVTFINGKLKLVNCKQSLLHTVKFIWLQGTEIGSKAIVSQDRDGVGQGLEMVNLKIRGYDRPITIKGKSEGVVLRDSEIVGCNHGIVFDQVSVEPWHQVRNNHFNTVHAPIVAKNSIQMVVRDNNLYADSHVTRKQWRDGPSELIQVTGNDNSIRNNYHRTNPEGWRGKWVGL